MDPGWGATHQRVGALFAAAFTTIGDIGFTARRAAGTMSGAPHFHYRAR